MTEVDINGTGIARLPRREIVAFVRQCLTALRRARAYEVDVTDVSIVFAHDDTVRALNRKYRHKDRTTDVLTFPADRSYAQPDSKSGYPLGDIVISVDQARRQAKEQRHSLATEIQYLILHGIIHALGYDHATDKGEMNELEMRVRSRVGLM